MKIWQLMGALALIGLLAGPIVSCASSNSPPRESTGEYIDDATISTKVRAQLIGDKDLNVFQIDVTTFKGVVQLSGFVNSAAAKTRASTVVSGVEGVKGVRNDLIVK